MHKMEEKHEEFNQTKYINEYVKEKYDRLNIQVPKGKKDEIKEMLIDYEISINGYVKMLIEEHMSLNEEERNKRLRAYAEKLKELESKNTEKHPGGA